MYAAAAFLAGVVALLSFGVYTFLVFGWLIDIANPVALGGLVFMSVLAANLGEAQSQRWILRHELPWATCIVMTWSDQPGHV